MKMLIFLIILAVVASVVLWRVRVADAKRDLARREELKRKLQERKEAIRTEQPVEWPTIIRTVGKRPAEGDEQLPEPSMTSVQFKPVDHPSLHH